MFASIYRPASALQPALRCSDADLDDRRWNASKLRFAARFQNTGRELASALRARELTDVGLPAIFVRGHYLAPAAEPLGRARRRRRRSRSLGRRGIPRVSGRCGAGRDLRVALGVQEVERAHHRRLAVALVAATDLGPSGIKHRQIEENRGCDDRVSRPRAVSRAP
jgi:hypothetical protein